MIGMVMFIKNHRISANESDGYSNIDLTTRMKHVISHSTSDFDTNFDVHKSHLMFGNEFDGNSNTDLTTDINLLLVIRVQFLIRILVLMKILSRT